MKNNAKYKFSLNNAFLFRRCRKEQPGISKFAFVPGTMNTYSNAIIADLINKDTQHLYVLKFQALVVSADIIFFCIQNNV